MEIELGHGHVIVATFSQGERIGLLLRKIDTFHRVGKRNPENIEETYTPDSDDILIWLDTLEGAHVLQNQLSIAILALNDLISPAIFKANETLND